MPTYTARFKDGSSFQYTIPLGGGRGHSSGDSPPPPSEASHIGFKIVHEGYDEATALKEVKKFIAWHDVRADDLRYVCEYCRIESVARIAIEALIARPDGNCHMLCTIASFARTASAKLLAAEVFNKMFPNDKRFELNDKGIEALKKLKAKKS